MEIKVKLYSTLSSLLVAVGIVLFSINIWGLFKDIRSEALITADTRFPGEKRVPFDIAIKEMQKLSQENDDEFATRITKSISDSLVHIHWHREQDTKRFNQLIPIWENYFLYFMGKFSGIAEFEKYHYSDYERSIKRGVGICGDASMVMSQLLNKYSIENKIVSFPGHVVVSAQTSEGKSMIFDPDYGVVLPYTVDEINQLPTVVTEFYQDAGYKDSDVIALKSIYANPYQKWNGVQHFITKKHYFEKVAYALKWPLPILLIASGLFWRRHTLSKIKN
ncbi:MAG: hypothetical protein ACI9VT_000842 [Psychroserpens sp.]